MFLKVRVMCWGEGIAMEGVSSSFKITNVNSRCMSSHFISLD